MLVELAVENYAVIEKARVRFHKGLNLLTGETGSGKSLVVDALGLLFGGRASAEMIRTGADRARVSGIFEVSPSPTLAKLLDQAGIEVEDNELLVEREVQANGKSRAFVASRPATAALLRELAPHLGDIHGQHDQQQLFSPAVQCEMLDTFAQALEQRARIADAYRRWRKTQAELEEIERSSQEKLRLIDLWEFQRKEIEAVSPQSGEELELENERRVLRNVVKLEEAAGAAYDVLYESAQGVTAQLRAVEKRLDDLARIDENTAPIAASLTPAKVAVEEASHALRHYLGKLEADPQRLDEIEERLAALEKLKRKYGSTTEDILRFLATVRADLETVENSTARTDLLHKELTEVASEFRKVAAALTAKRKEAATQLAKRVETELAALAMERTRLEIRVSASDWSDTGADEVTILIAPNPGEEPKPLEKVASGGELSRVALALTTCTNSGKGSKSAPKTLVFDEVDAGVGGSAAEAVGRRLKKLSAVSQILCVTHLAQVAGFADHHYFVEKDSAKGRTIATIQELTPEARTKEIGRMLSGEVVTPEALRHARTLMKLAGTY